MHALVAHNRTGKRPRVLLLAAGFSAQYRVLRCAAALPADVHVLGTGSARSLSLSRYCRSFQEIDFGSAEEISVSAARIDEVASRLGVELILPSDASTTRFLIRARPHLATPCFVLPDLETFDALATKDRFRSLCRELGVAHPHTILLDDREDLLAELEAGRIALPAVLKPVNLAGGIGVLRIDHHDAVGKASSVDYSPVLVQEYVEGVDRSITVFCEHGRVTKRIVYTHPDGVFQFLREPALERIVEDIAARLKLSGVFNFDARIDARGKVWMLECNPRFFFNMDVAMVAGLNFAEAGRAQPSARDQQIRIPRALLAALLAFRTPNASDWKLLVHWLKDPLMFALVSCGYKRKPGVVCLTGKAPADARRGASRIGELLNPLHELQPRGAVRTRQRVPYAPR